VNFADISHHQSDPINWRVYSATRDRVALKASQGRGFTDNKFVQRWENAKNGLVRFRLPYHYLEPDNRGAIDFDYFIGVINSAGGLTSNDWLVLDTEKLDNAQNVHHRARAATMEFCNRAVARGFTRGIVYSYKFYLDQANIVANDLPPGWRMLWLADYTIGQIDSDIEVPPGWNRSQVIARQYTDKARVAGLTGEVDDSRVLKEWAKLPTTDPVPDLEKDLTIMDKETKEYLDKQFSLNMHGDETHLGNLDNAVKKAESAYNMAANAKASADEAARLSKLILDKLNNV
jgi:GH25 family lysozyme M1 (1,4-beta-N-acetylmuramidase)